MKELGTYSIKEIPKPEYTIMDASIQRGLGTNFVKRFFAREIIPLEEVTFEINKLERMALAAKTPRFVVPKAVAKEMQAYHKYIREGYFSLKKDISITEKIQGGVPEDIIQLMLHSKMLSEATRQCANAGLKNAKKNERIDHHIYTHLEYLIDRKYKRKSSNNKKPSKADAHVFAQGVIHAREAPTLIRTCDFDIATLNELYQGRENLPHSLLTCISVNPEQVKIFEF